jgi:hypothetical protein
MNAQSNYSWTMTILGWTPRKFTLFSKVMEYVSELLIANGANDLPLNI